MEEKEEDDLGDQGGEKGCDWPGFVGRNHVSSGWRRRGDHIYQHLATISFHYIANNT